MLWPGVKPHIVFRLTESHDYFQVNLLYLARHFPRVAKPLEIHRLIDVGSPLISPPEIKERVPILNYNPCPEVAGHIWPGV